MTVRNQAAARYASEGRWLIDRQAFHHVIEAASPWDSHQVIQSKIGRTVVPIGGEGAAPDIEERSDNVVLMPLRGVILPKPGLYSMGYMETYTEWWGRAFDAYVADPNVAGIAVDIDSPGGMVWGVEELAQKIYDARGQKPIYGVANPFAASAAFWLGTAFERLYVTPSGDIGSHGVVLTHMNIGKMLEEFGVEIEFIHAGKYKVEGNSYESLSEEARAEFQRGVDATMEKFTAALAKHTGKSTEDVLANFGQGRIFGAADAVERGMATHVGTIDEMIADIRSEVSASSGAEGDLVVRKVEKEPVEAVAVADPVEGTDDKAAPVINVPEGATLNVYGTASFSVTDGGNVNADEITDGMITISGSDGIFLTGSTGFSVTPPLEGIESYESAEAVVARLEAEEEHEDVEVRSVDSGEVRAADDSDMPLKGIGVNFGSESEDLGGFTEEFASGAFDESLGDDLLVLWQHNRENVLGRTTAGTAEFSANADSLFYAASPPDATWARDAMESIRRRDVTRSSFAFRLLPGGETWERRGSRLVRVVTRARLIEAGPQSLPAYTDSSVAVRSMEAFLVTERETKDEQRRMTARIAEAEVAG